MPLRAMRPVPIMALSKLDDLIARLTSLRIEVEDPDGLVRFTLGDDGRLLTVFIDGSTPMVMTRDAVRTSLTTRAGERNSTICSPPVTRQCGCRASNSGKL